MPSPSWGKLAAFSSLFLSSPSDNLSICFLCGGFASRLQAKRLPADPGHLCPSASSLASLARRGGHCRTLLLVSLELSLSPGNAVVFEVAGENQATAAVLWLPACFKDNAEEVKWLIQPECSVGNHCTWTWFSGEGWGSFGGRVKRE